MYLNNKEIELSELEL